MNLYDVCIKNVFGGPDAEDIIKSFYSLDDAKFYGIGFVTNTGAAPNIVTIKEYDSSGSGVLKTYILDYYNGKLEIFKL